MAENATMRLNKVLRELNISLDRAVEHLASRGYDIDARPTAKISGEVYKVQFHKFFGQLQNPAGGLLLWC